MSKRICIEPGCPNLVNAGATRCRTHARAQERARGTPEQRGYDRAFKRAKREPAFVKATHCATCGEPFTPDNPKTAGHVRAIRDHGPNDAGIVPECRRCNFGWRRA